MPFAWAAIAAAAGSVIGGAIQGDASKSAAGTQADAAKYAAQLQANQYQQTRTDLAPYREQGPVALSRLAYLSGTGPQPTDMQPGDPAMQPNAAGMLTRPFGMADFQASPAYQFNLEQGQKAIDKAAASRGAFYQPGTLQDISKFSQGLASNEYQNAFSNYQTNMGNIWSRLYGLAGTGQSASNQTGAFGAAAAGNIGQAAIGGANAQAAGTIGQANAYTGAIGNAYNAYLTQQILQRNQQPVVGGTGMTGGPNDPQW